MDEKDVQRINMQIANRLSRIEKEIRELKGALSEFGWLINMVKKLKIIGEYINYDETKSVEQRRKNFQ